MVNVAESEESEESQVKLVEAYRQQNRRRSRRFIILAFTTAFIEYFGMVHLAIMLSQGDSDSLLMWGLVGALGLMATVFLGIGFVLLYLHRHH